MKTTGVAESIAVLLRDNAVVMIPGLGAFKGTYMPAQVDQVLGELRPPRLQVEFDEALAANDGLLIGYLSDVNKMSPELAGAKVRGFVEDAQEALKKQKSVTFPEVGRLRLNIEGRVQFLPEDKNLLPESFGLPQMRVHPIRPLTDLAAQSAPAPNAGRPLSWSRRNAHVLWASLAAAIVVGFAVYAALSPEIKALFVMPQAKDWTEARVNIPPAEVGQVPENEGDAVPIPSVEEENLPEPELCLIAIGLFKDKENVRRLEGRIRTAGFEPFSEEMPGFTRVGVRLPFRQESEIQTALAAIRKNLSPDAFVLKRIGEGPAGD